MHATAWASQHSLEILPDWAMIRDSLVKGAAEAANYSLHYWDETAHVKHLTCNWEHNRLMAAEKLQPLFF